jgi:hypothetical protein
MIEIKHRYTGAVLHTVNAGSLSGADLSGADLSGANLSSANLGSQWVIQGQTRSDGYAFFLQRLTADTEPMIKAGCRYFTLAQGQAHWEATRQVQTPALFNETRAIVRALVDTMHIRGLK